MMYDIQKMRVDFPSFFTSPVRRTFRVLVGAVVR